MAIILVPTDHLTITAAIAAAAPGDIIQVEASYANFELTEGAPEVEITVDDLIFDGLTSATDIVLILGSGVTNFTTTGTTTFNIVDNDQNNVIITSNANSVVGVTGGVDTVTMGTGTADILGVDFTLASGNVTGNTANLVAAGGGFDVTMSGVEHFAVATGSGNDNFTLGTGDDIVHLGAGNDTVDTGDGLDIIDAGDVAYLAEYGYDLVNYSVGVGDDNITSGAGDDVVIVGGGLDVVAMGAGSNDLLIVNFAAATGNVTGTHSSQFFSNQGDFTDFNVSMTGVEHFSITTGSGNDSFTLGGGEDFVSLGSGNDQVDTALGLAKVNGGSGDDYWLGDLSNLTTAVTLNLNTALITQDIGGGNFVESIERINLTTGSGNDTITTTSALFSDTVNTGDGNDTVTVSRGHDFINMGAGTDDHLIIDFAAATGNVTGSHNSQINSAEGAFVAFNAQMTGVERYTVTTGSGNDSFSLGAGNDSVNLGTGSDTVNTGAGDDAITLATGGADSVDGGDNNDTLTVTFSASGIAITGGSGTSSGTFNAGAFGSLVYSNIENFDLILTAQDDNISTGAGADFIDGGFGNDTMNGGNGNDFYFVDSVNDVIIENNADTATGGIDTIVLSASIGTYVLAANVERINLQGDANGTGNASINTINGSTGNNILDGGADSVTDILNGGTGDDTYVLGDGLDTVNDIGGTDTITSTITRSLVGYTDIENLTLVGTTNIDGTGSAGINTITGNSGNNILDGGADTVADTLIGGDGDDTYLVSDQSDIISDNSGIDTIVVSAGNFGLGTHSGIENLTLTGTAEIGSGNALVNIITGNALAVNVLDGGGNDGVVDTLNGGDGDDWYNLYEVLDTIIDSSGFDRINTSFSASLVGFAGIENLFLLGNSAINGTGNGLANTVVGNQMANILDGGNDNVVDTLVGGGGDDTFVLYDDLEKVFDHSGVDTIKSTISRNLADYTLSAVNLTQTIENLTLLGSGTANGTGNGLVNIIIGNSGANVLNGGTDSVVDSLRGAAGNDTYVLANGADSVVDTSGIDTITSTITRSLLSYTAIEKLTLLGTAAINGTGNILANTIVGNSAVNTIIGGRAVDILTGGGGADKFQFNALNEVGDQIKDMSTSDFIVLQNTAFTGLTTANKATAFVSRATDNNAQDTNDRLIYRQSDDTLWYDSNGSTAGGTKVMIADFSTNIALTASDIIII